MICYQCGKELQGSACFCHNCGAPVRDTIRQHGSVNTVGEADPDPAAVGEQVLLTAGLPTGTDDISVDPEMQEYLEREEAIPQANRDRKESSDPQEASVQGKPDMQESSGSQDSSSGPEEVSQETFPSALEIPVELVLKKGYVTVSGNELYLHRKHYARKSGQKKFRKEKKSVRVPLASIPGASVEHYKYGGQMFLALLLLLCFAVGAWYSVRCGYDAYLVMDTPYREGELAAQESIMAVIDGDGAERLLQCRNSQEENSSAARALTEDLAALEAQRRQEILDAITQDRFFDLDVFFNRELFSCAYQEYLQELLDAFKADESLHSWLYSYYGTSKAYGGNDFLDTDMWIYNGENGFSTVLDSADSLMSEQYDLDFYEHMVFTGRIYITGADFMRVVLSLPRYTVEGAVFARAYGGVPDASEMFVPGWGRSHYEEFWLYGVDYYSVDAPMWLDYGLSAGNFDVDWNDLLDEGAYYGAYQNFMDKIAPGLSRYEMASYQADDGAYGGMGCHLKGEEPSVYDMIASYAEGHPGFTDEWMEKKAQGKLLTTSVDEEIAETKAQLEKLGEELLELREQEEELAQLLADADVHRREYQLLLSDMEQHMRESTHRLLFFGGTGLLCLLGGLVCLCSFIGFLKRPRHLFVVSGQDVEYAFHAKLFPREQIEALQNRLSAGH